MDNLKELIAKYKAEVIAENPAVADGIENFRIKYLGTKGLVKTIMGEIGRAHV